MRLDPDHIAFDQGSLWVGVKIHGPQGSWLKFATLEIPLAEISERDFRSMMIWRVENDWTPAAEQDQALF